MRSGIFNGSSEIKLLKSHTIGRAAFITYASHKKAGLKDRMILARHKNVEVHLGYDRVDTASAARRVHEARQRANGNGGDQVEHDPLDDMSKEELLDLLRRITKRLGG